MCIKIQKNYTIQIPKSVIDRLGLREGSMLDCEISEGSIYLAPIRRSKKKIVMVYYKIP